MREKGRDRDRDREGEGGAGRACVRARMAGVSAPLTCGEERLWGQRSPPVSHWGGQCSPDPVREALLTETKDASKPGYGLRGRVLVVLPGVWNLSSTSLYTDVTREV